MIKKLTKLRQWIMPIVLLTGMVSSSVVTNAQCTTNTSLYPSGTFTPTCPSPTAQTITGCNYASEYAKINVVAGNIYVFGSSIGTDFLTIANDAAPTTGLVWGTGSVTYNATFTGVVRLYINLNSTCSTNSLCRATTVQCMVAAPPASCGTLSAPSAGAIVTDFPSLSWTSVAGATQYDIYLSNDGGSTYSVHATTTTNSYTFTSALTPGTYHWFVTPKNSYGDATGCDANARTFIVSDCNPPSGVTVSGVVYNGAVISWTPSTSPTTNYEYIISTSNTPPDASTLVSEDPTTDTFIDLSGSLSANQPYYVWIRTSCSGGTYSPWTSTVSFTTPCATPTLPWTENFDALTTIGLTSFPPCWFKQNGDWRTSNDASYSYNNSRSPSNYLTNAWSAANEYIWTNAFSLVAGTTYEFSFWYVGDGFTGWNPTVMVNNAQSSVGATTVGTPVIGLTETSSTTYQQKKVLFTPTTTGIYYFGINMNANSTPWYFGFDDFMLQEAPVCIEPTAITASTTSASEALVTFTASTSATGGYEYIYSTSSATPSATATPSGTLAAGTTSFTLSGLSMDSTYYVFIRSICSGTDKSVWSYDSWYQGYCVPTSSLTYGYVSNVNIGEINNTTGASTFWGNYTSQVVNIGQGTSKTGSITMTTAGSNRYVTAWIDWNKDLDFDDAGEQFYFDTTTVASGTETLPFSITVPLTTDTGNYRMRIGSGYYYTPFTPCSVIYYGEWEDYTVHITPPPTCAPPLVVSATGTATSINANWTPSTSSSAAGYEYIVTSTFGIPTVSGTATTDTFMTATGLTANTFYYVYVRTNCGATDGFSEWTYTTFYTGYCVPTSLYTYGYLSNVSIGSINNTTTAATYLGDYTSQVLDVGQGTTTTGSLTMSTAGSNRYVTAWIDWNRDLDFNDPGEQIYNDTTTVPSGTETLPFSVSISSTTDTGNYRMRIGSVAYYPPVDPCVETYYGEWEDYTVHVGPPPTCNAVTGLTAAPTMSSVSASWTPSTSTSTIGYEYIVTTTPGLPTTTGTTTTDTFLNVTGLSASTTYYVYVRTNCDADGYSTWTSVSTFTGYCTPAPTSMDGSGITNVTTGTINNATGGETGYYGDYSALSTDVYATQTVSVAITYATGYTYGTKIWVDWNKNLVFEASEQMAYGLSSSASPTTITLNFTVPDPIDTGMYRMRIGGSDGDLGPTPCYTGSWASFEDYSLHVVPQPSCLPPSALTASAITTSSATVSWTASTSTETEGYDYYIATTSTTPTASTAPTGSVGTGVTTTDFTGLSTATTYYVWVRTQCSTTDSSTWSTPVMFSTYNSCTEGNFYDSGGPTGNYTNNERDTTTFFPSAPGQKVRVVFNSMAFETCCDNLTIYDGPDVTSPVVGTYNSTTLPPPYTSTHATGALTFRFYSDGSIVNTGWDASIYCCDTTAVNVPTTACNGATVEGVYVTNDTSFVKTYAAASGCDSNVRYVVTISALGGSPVTATSSDALPISSSGATYFGTGCDVIASVSSSVDLGIVSAEAVVGAVSSYNGHPYLGRHYEITSTNTGAATVTLYFTQEEFDAYNTSPLLGAFPQILVDGSNLKITAFHSPAGSGAGPDGHDSAASTVQLITPSSIVFNATYSRWDVTFSTDSFSGFYAHTVSTVDPTPLPIQLGDIRAINRGSEHVVIWNTLKEATGDIFNIERSANGSNFEYLGTLPANGTPSEYSFVDVKPYAGTTFYRLFMVDNDGNKHASKIVSAKLATSFSIDAYPNPTNKNITVRINGKIGANATIKVTDVTGRVVREILEVTENVNTVELDNLSAGYYFIKYEDDNHSEIIKITKK